MLKGKQIEKIEIKDGKDGKGVFMSSDYGWTDSNTFYAVNDETGKKLVFIGAYISKYATDIEETEGVEVTHMEFKGESSQNKEIVVLYHSNCYDGFGAAYACWKRFGDSADYIPVSYGFPVPDTSSYNTVYLVDFSYKREEILALCDKHKVYVLDHHKTAEAELKDLEHKNLYVEFDMTRSGALIAWENLHSVQVPELIKYISDRDLWNFEFGEKTKKIHKALVSYPMDFELWDNLDVEKLAQEGVVCERLYTSLVNNIVKSAWIKKVAEHDVPVVNTSIAWSEVGEQLLQNYPKAPFAASFTVFSDQVMWSLRSRKTEDFDVSKIAEKFGGGGHKNAAGFKTQRF